MDTLADWKRIEVNHKFAFWIPANLTELKCKAIDSFVRRWEGKNIIVHFDYGRFSDPLTFYSRQKAYESAEVRIGGHSATFVRFQRQEGWWFTAVHFPDLGRDPLRQKVKLTLVIESGPEVGKDVPWKIVNSITFEET